MYSLNYYKLTITVKNYTASLSHSLVICHCTDYMTSYADTKILQFEDVRTTILMTQKVVEITVDTAH